MRPSAARAAPPTVPKESFRQSFLKHDIEQVSLGILIWQIPYLGFAVSDFLTYRLTVPFWGLLGVRLVIVLFSIMIVCLLRGAVHRPNDFDRLTLAWGLITVTGMTLVSLTRPLSNTSAFLVDLVGIITLYVFFPTQLIARAVPAIAYSVIEVLIAIFWKDHIPALTIVALTFSLAMMNMVGIIAARRWLNGRRKEYDSRIAEEKQRLELERLASTDPLTGVLNRRRLIEGANESLVRFRRYRRPFSIVLLDMDGFKRVNDTFGHQQGDATLIQFTKIIASEKREADILGRMGGDEFCIVLPETTSIAAAMLADRLLKRCSEIEINVNGSFDVGVSISLGITEARAEDTSLDMMFARADAALYQAKNWGRGRWEIL